MCGESVCLGEVSMMPSAKHLVCGGCFILCLTTRTCASSLGFIPAKLQRKLGFADWAVKWSAATGSDLAGLQFSHLAEFARSYTAACNPLLMSAGLRVVGYWAQNCLSVATCPSEK